VAAKIVTMVRSEKNDGVPGEIVGVEKVEQSANVTIDG